MVLVVLVVVLVVLVVLLLIIIVMVVPIVVMVVLVVVLIKVPAVVPGVAVVLVVVVVVVPSLLVPFFLYAPIEAHLERYSVRSCQDTSGAISEHFRKLVLLLEICLRFYAGPKSLSERRSVGWLLRHPGAS